MTSCFFVCSLSLIQTHSSFHSFRFSSGWYALITLPHTGARSSVARLVSPNVAATGSNSKCLRFWYHIYGPHIDTLSVYTNSSYNSSLGYPIWQKTGTQGNQWNEAVVSVQQSLPFTVSIVRIRFRIERFHSFLRE
jgi:hypothetical protein